MAKIENIEGFPGYYMSKRGRLFSNKSGSWVELKPRKYKREGKVFRHRRKIYNRIGLSVFINYARVVAKIYVYNPKPDLYNVVCHKDNNPENNHYKNLYWGTQVMNMAQMVADGRSMVGELNGRSSLTNQQTLQIITQYKLLCGKAQEELAELHGVSKSAIKHIVKKYNHYKSIFRDEF